MARAMVVQVATIVVMTLGAAGGAGATNQLSEHDERAVRAATQRYRDAWLINDDAAVMATLTPDAVIMPSGMKPLSGATAIRRFWFPSSGPKTRVTSMELRVHDVSGSGAVAVVRGLGTLTYVLTNADGREQTVSQASWFVNVLERQPGGAWLITCRAWSDLRAPAP